MPQPRPTSNANRNSQPPDYEELKRDYDMLSKIYNHDDHADYFELRRHDDGFRITVHLPCGFNIHELRSYCSIYGYWIHDDRSSETPTDEHHRTFTLLYDSALTSTGTVEEITVDLIHLRDYRNYVIRNDTGRVHFGSEGGAPNGNRPDPPPASQLAKLAL